MLSGRLGCFFLVSPLLPWERGALFPLFTRFSGVFVCPLRGDLNLSPCLLRASYGIVRLTPVDFEGVGDALLFLGPCPSSWRTCILGTVYSISSV